MASAQLTFAVRMILCAPRCCPAARGAPAFHGAPAFRALIDEAAQ